MDTAGRHEVILRELLHGNGHVLELSKRLGVSASTIRRDLKVLTDTGRVTRTYGGAVIGNSEPTLQQKDQKHPAQKEAIALLAATHVEDGETLVLDAGTTTGRLAWHLRHREGLHVVTNGVNAITTLRESDAVDVTVLGGELRHKSQALQGPIAEETLRSLSADTLFLGADGITAEHGVSNRYPALSSLKRLMVERAGRVYVLADHSKIGASPFHYWTPLERPYTVITDSDATAEQLRPFHDSDLATVLVA
ncbi:DeoR family transcriptional regulator [Haloactinopolyspora alba]|uniref:DeoR family transcriptional regulator n=1 Tax=Haloactinopolyspora alba TaxID=648780 RepID=A0A2P8EF08_9ACTN|nr:DeoR/GlpR family DNA-binding transcription regulator [Haloactinopolyspora alba]PSL08062.1 DeoR family transcriptional regulator [Haloactinopolyspora alba]